MIYKRHSTVAAVCPAGHEPMVGARMVEGSVGIAGGEKPELSLEIASQEQTN